MSLRIGNPNACKLRLDARGSDAWNARVTVVRELAPELLGLQEIVADEAANPATNGMPSPPRRSPPSLRTAGVRRYRIHNHTEPADIHASLDAPCP